MNLLGKTHHELVHVQYSDYYVVFLDALGFSEKIMTPNKDNLKKISDYFTVVNESLKELKEIESKSDIASFVISDSIILAIPSGAMGGDPIATLRELSIAVQKVQWNLVKYDIWFRGAITRGDCWVDKNAFQIAGPAYIKAVTLEKEAAKYPRVIIDPAVVRSLNIKNRNQFAQSINGGLSSSDSYLSGPIFDWQRTTRIRKYLNDDTLAFVDYMGLGVSVDMMPELNVILDYVERALFEQKTYEKYRWLVNYLYIRVGSDSVTSHFPHLSGVYSRLQAL